MKNRFEKDSERPGDGRYNAGHAVAGGGARWHNIRHDAPHRINLRRGVLMRNCDRGYSGGKGNRSFGRNSYTYNTYIIYMNKREIRTKIQSRSNRTL